VKLRDQGRPLAVFERPVEVWKVLRAPRELWDAVAAARAWRAIAPAAERLDDPDFPEGPVRQILAHRYWRVARPAFLADLDQLTARERDLMDRFPQAYRLPEWWP
jgi:hypothetical protein